MLSIYLAEFGCMHIRAPLYEQYLFKIPLSFANNVCFFWVLRSLQPQASYKQSQPTFIGAHAEDKKRLTADGCGGASVVGVTVGFACPVGVSRAERRFLLRWAHSREQFFAPVLIEPLPLLRDILTLLFGIISPAIEIHRRIRDLRRFWAGYIPPNTARVPRC